MCVCFTDLAEVSVKSNKKEEDEFMCIHEPTCG